MLFFLLYIYISSFVQNRGKGGSNKILKIEGEKKGIEEGDTEKR